jgi:Ca-activated chloride channel family protein
MGNCATKLQKYERAKIYYQKALALGYDKEAYANLLLVYNIKEKKDISDMLPPTEVKKETQASKKSEAKKDDSKKKKEKNNNSQSSDSKAANEAIQSSDGSASSKGKEKKKGKNSDTINKAKYQIAYKAYELMNEGYTNETHPW